ncbi:hypothetical protein GH714_004879 [Hevea brasiliensis]|uniref:Serine-threonine/tyrosine-protein kinase catalytic domain-containing protein n=1 Tax=Hevea brasiliensis TaxID=3981 RepID=A0A6A6LYT9_HEVBR|nr:hypothetical protein GH714_004879 [Hevea brasiliensis]
MTSNLEILSLGENNFSGLLKPGIGKLYNLRTVKAGYNSFTDPIPPEIANLSQLITLSLCGSRFSVLIPPTLSKLSSIQGLVFQSDALEGPIPENISELKHLTFLMLGLNRLAGPIPDAVSKLEMLSYLDLHSNMLNGSIPSKCIHEEGNNKSRCVQLWDYSDGVPNKRRPTQMTEEDGLPISQSQVIEKALGNGINGLLQVLDPLIAMNISKEEETLIEFFKLTLFCTNPNPDKRPNMNEVLSSLKRLRRQS